MLDDIKTGMSIALENLTLITLVVGVLQGVNGSLSPQM